MEQKVQAAELTKKAEEIIRRAQIGSAVAAGIAFVPGIYNRMSLPVAAELLIDLGNLFGHRLTAKEASSILMAHTKFKPKWHAGLGVLGLFPVVGGITGGAIASMILREIGWASFLALSEGKNLKALTQQDWDHYFSEATNQWREVP